MLLLAALQLHAALAAPVNPVILVPGLFGSMIKATLTDKQNNPNIFCKKNSEEYTIWVNLGEFVPPFLDCFLDNMTPRWDPVNKTFNPPQGVTLNTNVDFGGVAGITYLDPSLKLGDLDYFGHLVDELTSTYGFEVGVSLRGAPYDWRLAPNSLGDYYAKVKALVEETYALNNNERVIFVTHSMGGPITLYFLNQMDQAWKDQYIAAFMPIAGPFGGDSLTMEALASGDNLGIPLVPHSYFWPMQIHFTSELFLFPDPATYGDQVLVQTPSKNYTAFDLKQYVTDLGMDFALEYYDEVMSVSMPALTAPLVNTYPFQASGTQTAISVTYASDLVPGKPNPAPSALAYADGDGTVPLFSAEVALQWQSAQNGKGYQLKDSMLYNVTHTGMLSDKTSLQQMTSFIAQLSGAAALM